MIFLCLYKKALESKGSQSPDKKKMHKHKSKHTRSAWWLANRSLRHCRFANTACWALSCALLRTHTQNYFWQSQISMETQSPKQFLYYYRHYVPLLIGKGQFVVLMMLMSLLGVLLGLCRRLQRNNVPRLHVN
ncbi:hypothetical protein CEXT_381511 [Caerostris extrusa]|uniref:Uncharacterized protein n=1 Tax=Caerostris extrusa TaxID=172846 RepID=A0AAV4SBQ2_CAEEX|nr:hypothetical protein CEXT_381511 [Caerostris extrusa]